MGIYVLLFPRLFPFIQITLLNLHQRVCYTKWITLVWIWVVWIWVIRLRTLPPRALRWIWAWAGLLLVKVSACLLCLDPHSSPPYLIHSSLNRSSHTILLRLIHANPSLDALELVHRRHLLPLIHMAQQHQSKIRRISNRCILPRNRHRRFVEVSKRLRSTYHQTSYGTSYRYEWEW